MLHGLHATERHLAAWENGVDDPEGRLQHCLASARTHPLEARWPMVHPGRRSAVPCQRGHRDERLR